MSDGEISAEFSVSVFLAECYFLVTRLPCFSSHTGCTPDQDHGAGEMRTFVTEHFLIRQ